MPAYMLFIREEPVFDQAAMDEYNQHAPAAVAGHDMKPIFWGSAIQTVEGKAPDDVVIVEFPSVEAAQNWYFSPAYQAAREYRLKGAAYRVMILDGYKG